MHILYLKINTICVGKTKKKLWFSWFILISITLLNILACSLGESFSPEEQISFYLPAWPPTKNSDLYPDLSGWQISFLGENYSESFYLPAETESFSHVVLKNDVLFIQAIPITLWEKSTIETIFFEPAGSVYPSLCKNNTVELTWEDGFTAKLGTYLYKYCESHSMQKERTKNFLSHINWRKLSTKIHDNSNSEQNFYNPWKLNFPKTVNSLSTGTFNAVKLNIKPAFEDSESFSDFILSSYIPENNQIHEKKVLPIYENSENRFMISENQMIIIKSENGKKHSAITVFMPRKIDRDSLCKKNLNDFY